MEVQNSIAHLSRMPQLGNVHTGPRYANWQAMTISAA